PARRRRYRRGGVALRPPVPDLAHRAPRPAVHRRVPSRERDGLRRRRLCARGRRDGPASHRARAPVHAHPPAEARMNELIVALGIGVLAGSGTWLLLRPRTFQVLIGLSLLSYAVNLFIVAMGRLRIGAAPIVEAGTAADPAAFADPLPQALVL